MHPTVIKVKAIKEYQVMFTYDNGEKRLFDMHPYLETGLFAQLKDKELFGTVRVSFDTIEWGNRLDIDPEVLYMRSVPVS